MTTTAKQLLAQALSLSEDERVAIAGELLGSVETEAGVREAWIREVRQRAAAVDSGEMQLLSATEARQRIFRLPG